MTTRKYLAAAVLSAASVVMGQVSDHSSAAALRNVGLALRSEGKSAQAREKFEAALRLAPAESLLFAGIQADLAGTYIELDGLKQAGEILESASRTLASSADSDTAARAGVAASIGLGYLQLGIRPRAENHIRNAFTAASQARVPALLEKVRILRAAIGIGGDVENNSVSGDLKGDARLLARDLRIAGNTSLDNFRYADGLRCLKYAAALADTGADAESAASIDNDLALAYVRVGAMREAVMVLEKATRFPDGRGTQQMFWNLGCVHLSLAATLKEHLAKALDAFSKLRTSGEASGDAGAVASALAKEAVIVQSRDGPKASLPLFTRARELARRADPVSEARVLNALGMAYLAAGDTAAGERALRESLAKLHSSRQYRLEAVVLRNLGMLLEDRGKPEEAIALYLRAISTLEEYHGLPPDSWFEMPGEDAYQSLVRLLVRAGRGREAFGIAERARVAASRPNPRFKPVPIEQLQLQMPEDLALLSYFNTGARVYGFAVRRNQFVTFEVAQASTAINRLIAEVSGGALAASRQALQQLYNSLLAPARNIADAPAIAFVPSGTLCYLPFAALLDGDKYLADNHSVFVLPTASAVIALPRPEQTGRGLLLYSDSEALPGSEDKYGGMPQARQSTRAGFFTRAPESGIIHMDGKLWLDPNTPWFSKASAITAYEIGDLDLRKTGLVVLGPAEREPTAASYGDEALIVPRELIAAGAASVVASPWPVPEEAAQSLMVSFFQNLRKKQSKVAALRNAEAQLRQTYPWPSIWAAFSVIGDPGVVETIETPLTGNIRISGLLQQVEWPFLLIESRDRSRLRVEFLSGTRLHRGGEPVSPELLRVGAEVALQVRVNDDATFSAASIEVVRLPALTSDAAPTDPIIEAAASVAAEASSKLPDFNCGFRTRRSTSQDGGLTWRASDVITAEVVYVSNEEVYRNIMRGRTGWKGGIMDIGGYTSTGNYGHVLRSLFRPSVGARFQFQGEEMLNGRAVFVYDYTVGRDSTDLRLTDNGVSVKPAYHGRVWIDKASLWVWKVRFAADEEIPMSFPWRSSNTEVVFDLMNMRDAGRFLLPKASTEIMCLRTGNECKRNETSYDEYKRFQSSSEVTFGEVKEAPTAPKVGSGSLIWTGDLKPFEVLTIQSGRTTQGSLSGEPFPGAAVSVATEPELDVIDSPNAQNSWNRLVLRNGGRRIKRLEIKWRAQP